MPFAPGTYYYSPQVLTLPAPFSMNWGNPRLGGSSLSVAPGGWMYFSSTAATYEYSPPANAGVIAPWSGYSLKTDANSTILWQLDGTGDQQRLIVQWNDLPTASYPNKRVTFQAQVYASGEIVYAYKNVQGFAATDVGTPILYEAAPYGAVQPTAVQLGAVKTPSSGDSYHFHGLVPLPFPVTALNQNWAVSVDMGNGRLVIEDGPELIAPGKFYVSEINYNPAVGMEQWFEIQNTTAQPIDLNGWYVDFGGGITLSLSNTQGTTILPANGRLLLGQTPNSAEGIHVDYAYGSTYVMPVAPGKIGLGLAGAIYTASSWNNAGTQGVALQTDASLGAIGPVTGVTLSCPATASYGTHGQKGTPGTQGTYCMPYRMTQIPGNFVSILNTGTQIGTLGASASYSVYQTLTLPRPVKIEGQSVSTLYVAATGFISKTILTSYYTYAKIVPSSTIPVGAIAPFWDTLTGNAANSKVAWQQFDPDGVANSGDEYTLISWENWNRSGYTCSLNFQVKFMEATGDIEFHYGAMTGPVDFTSGKYAGAWIERQNGTAALAISSRTPNSIQPNTGYHFTYSP
jgi:hypothetical protein